jgi:glycosyltransferase involved in cell wall biosynthesis
MKNQAELSIVIPLYNEEDNAAPVLKDIDYALKTALKAYEIIAVNNGSIDNTGLVLKKLEQEIPSLKVITVPVNQGYGWGILAGLKESSGSYVGFMCGDNQVEPAALIDVYNKAVNECLDLCKVRRIKRHDGAVRKIITFFYNIICPFLFSISAGDLNGTPKVFKRAVFEKLGLVSKGWFIDAEIMIKCARLGCRIGEVPIVFKKREKGSSKINPKAVIGFLKEMFRYRFGSAGKSEV